MGDFDGYDASEESEQRYRQLIETSPAPINLFDSTGKTVWGNDAVVDLLGLDSREDLIGRSIFDFIKPEDRFTAEQELAAVVEDKRATGPTSMQLQTATGETKTIRVSTAPGRYNGEDIGQAVVVDVTRLNEVQSALSIEQQFIQDALDTLEDVFFVLDLDGALVRWNRSLLDVSGYDETEVRNMDVEDFFVSDDMPRVSESIATALEEGEDTMEAMVVTKDGTTIPYEFRKRRLLWDGEIVGVSGIGRDVSEHRARDQYLRNIDKLLYHSLRNQLNIIQGNTEMLQTEVADTGQTRLETIAYATRKLQSTFEKHHHITDFVTNTQPTSQVDVVPILEEIINTKRESYPRVDITSELPEEASILAMSGITQALEELVTNAIVHNDHSNPTVKVVVDIVDSMVAIRIIDNGPAVSEMDRKVVTGEQTVSSTYHSEGLGLWFVYWIVTQSGGTLSLSANQSRGNVVTIEVRRPEPSQKSSATP